MQSAMREPDRSPPPAPAVCAAPDGGKYRRVALNLVLQSVAGVGGVANSYIINILHTDTSLKLPKFCGVMSDAHLSCVAGRRTSFVRYYQCELGRSARRSLAIPVGGTEVLLIPRARLS